MKKLVPLAATGAALAALAGCDSVTEIVSGVIGDEPLTAETASVKVDPGHVIFGQPGDTVRFTAQLLDAKGRVVEDAPSAKWTTDGYVFWIDSIGGLAGTVGYGEATVTVRFELPDGSVSDSAIIELPPISELSIGPSRAVTFDESSETLSIEISAIDTRGRKVPPVGFGRTWFEMRNVRDVLPGRQAKPRVKCDPGTNVEGFGCSYVELDSTGIVTLEGWSGWGTYRLHARATSSSDTHGHFVWDTLTSWSFLDVSHRMNPFNDPHGETVDGPGVNNFLLGFPPPSEPPVAYEVDVLLNPLITNDQPSALDSVRFVGTAPYTRSADPGDTATTHIFDATFTSGHTTRFQHDPTWYSGDPPPAPDYDLAIAETRGTALNVGRLPAFMYEATSSVTLNWGLAANVCGPWMAVMATTVERSSNEDRVHGDGYLIHEVGHTIDPVSCGGITDAEWWDAVAADDNVYITGYARSNRFEDVAEMTWAWMISRCVPDRFHPAYKKYIDLYVGNRLALLDREWLREDWTPYSCGTESLVGRLAPDVMQGVRVGGSGQRSTGLQSGSPAYLKPGRPRKGQRHRLGDESPSDLCDRGHRALVWRGGEPDGMGGCRRRFPVAR